MALKDASRRWVEVVSAGFADTEKEKLFKARCLDAKYPLDTFLLDTMRDFRRIGIAGVNPTARFFFTEGVEDDVKQNMREAVRIAADFFGYIAFSDDENQPSTRKAAEVRATPPPIRISEGTIDYET